MLHRYNNRDLIENDIGIRVSIFKGAGVGFSLYKNTPNNQCLWKLSSDSGSLLYGLDGSNPHYVYNLDIINCQIDLESFYFMIRGIFEMDEKTFGGGIGNILHTISDKFEMEFKPQFEDV